MAGNSNSGDKPTWDTPKSLLDDFEAFIEDQKPHIEKQLKNVKKGRGSDYTYKIEEVDVLVPQGLVTISQFAAWKGLHRTTIMTGYSEGKFKPVYQKMLAICEAYSEKRLYEAERNAANIIFAMKNSYGWEDATKTELSGSIDSPLSDEAKAYLAKATRADDDKGFSEE